jgi:hypothetical protein
LVSQKDHLHLSYVLLLILDCGEYDTSSLNAMPTKDGNGQPGTSSENQEVHFAGVVQVGRTYPRKEYERGAMVTWNLSMKKVEKIKREINTFKKDMDVHEASSKYTHFYR